MHAAGEQRGAAKQAGAADPRCGNGQELRRDGDEKKSGCESRTLRFMLILMSNEFV